MKSEATLSAVLLYRSLSALSEFRHFRCRWLLFRSFALSLIRSLSSPPLRLVARWLLALLAGGVVWAVRLNDGQ